MRVTKLKNNFLIFILVLTIGFFFKPTYLKYADFSTIEFIYLIGLRVICLIIFIIYIVKSRISKYIIALFTFYIAKFLITFINGGALKTVIGEMYPILALCMLVEICIDKKQKELLQAFFYVLNFLAIISFITIVIKPEGYGTIYEKFYFLSPGNQLAAFYILSTVISYINAYSKKEKALNLIVWIFIGINTYSIFKVKSSTGIIAWAVLMIYICVPYVKNMTRVFNFKNYVIGYIIFFISVVIFKIQILFSNILQQYLDKNITFTSRTFLWEIAISEIKKRPIIGYGANDTSNIIYFNNAFLSAHNQFIQILYEGGIISLICFLVITYIGGWKLVKYKQNKIAGILSIGILSMWFVMFSEAMGFFYFFILLAFSYNINKFKTNNET